VSGGSEAVEAALKLARQFFVEKGELHRTHIIARRQSYHGNTLGALAAGGNEWRRKQFSPLLTDFSHIAPCYEYAERADSESSWDYGQRSARALEDEILRLGPDTVIAFLAEPVVGATSGAVPAVDGYFRQIREICNKYGVLLILDEVMCGMGRTGYLFASEYDDIAPDIVCIAKGLGAGYQPIGAMLCQSEIYQAISEGSGFFQHGHTYLGHPVAAAAGCAVFKELDSKDLVSRVHDLGPRFESALREQFLDHQMVGDIRGRGLFWAIELVSNKETKEPFDPTLRLAANIKKAAFENGLICYPMAGTRDGVNGDHVLLAPPFIIDDSQIEELIGKLASAIDVCTPQHTAA
jgi:adenosylmethionine-8-amino-7-oxononanoate aminotransferase